MTLIDGTWVNEDTRLLRATSSAAVTDAEVGPFRFDPACAPQVAAALEGRAIDRGAILEEGRALLARCDFVVVEGVGGFCVPLGPDWDSSHIACGLGLPVILAWISMPRNSPNRGPVSI
jgi:dethiobiotin synthetase